MEIFDLRAGQSRTEFGAPTVVALGQFDGVHIGHRALLREATAYRDAHPGTCAVAWTFRNHPKNRQVPPLISTREQYALFADCGVDFAVSVDFASVCRLTPSVFVQSVLSEQLSCCAAVCGFNFRFGYQASGDASLLRKLLVRQAASCCILDGVTVDNTLVSTSAIRALLTQGDMKTVNRMLGREYAFDLPVRHGRHLATEIGFPTVNQRLSQEVSLPRFGVYASVCEIDGVRYRAVSNIGVRPTIDGTAPVCETHIFDFDGDIYGKTVRVIPLVFIRQETKFTCIGELKEAIIRDVAICRSLN